jgi:hypothetical protein
LTLLGGVEAWAAKTPSVGRQRLVARWVAVVWLIAAAWVGVLLIWYVASSGTSGPPPVPAATYLGLPAAVYHMVGLYGGAALVAWSAFRPSGPSSVPVTTAAESASD